MKFKQKSFRKIPDSLANIPGKFLLGKKLSDLTSDHLKKFLIIIHGKMVTHSYQIKLENFPE